MSLILSQASSKVLFENPKITARSPVGCSLNNGETVSLDGSTYQVSKEPDEMPQGRYKY